MVMTKMAKTLSFLNQSRINYMIFRTLKQCTAVVQLIGGVEANETFFCLLEHSESLMPVINKIMPGSKIDFEGETYTIKTDDRSR